MIALPTRISFCFLSIEEAGDGLYRRAIRADKRHPQKPCCRLQSGLFLVDERKFIAVLSGNNDTFGVLATRETRHTDAG